MMSLDGGADHGLSPREGAGGAAGAAGAGSGSRMIIRHRMTASQNQLAEIFIGSF